MNEAEWLAAADPSPMVEFIRVNAGERKLRLFAVTCCQRIAHLWRDDRSREAVMVAERHANGAASDEELDEARESASDACGTAYQTASDGGWSASAWSANAAANAAYGACGHWQNWVADSRLFEAPIWAALAGPAVEGVLSDTGKSQAMSAEMGWQSEQLRDIVGNPFRSGTLDQRWRTADVLNLASAIYADRAFDRMPILADALMDAGCNEEQVIGHCRGDRPHVRGCWVVDLVLGKE